MQPSGCRRRRQRGSRLPGLVRAPQQPAHSKRGAFPFGPDARAGGETEESQNGRARKGPLEINLTGQCRAQGQSDVAQLAKEIVQGEMTSKNVMLQ